MKRGGVQEKGGSEPPDTPIGHAYGEQTLSRSCYHTFSKSLLCSVKVVSSCFQLKYYQNLKSFRFFCVSTDLLSI